VIAAIRFLPVTLYANSDSSSHNLSIGQLPSEMKALDEKRVIRQTLAQRNATRSQYVEVFAYSTEALTTWICENEPYVELGKTKPGLEER
jgi:hypothetical protein